MLKMELGLTGKYAVIEKKDRKKLTLSVVPTKFFS